MAKEHLVKTSHPWVLSETSFQKLLELEVDLAVLSKELTKLVDFSTRIGDTFRGLRLSQQEQELLD